MNDNGTWLEYNESMRSLISDYFQHLFSSEVGVPDDRVLNKVKHYVTEYINETLLAPYTAEDVKNALFSIGDLKAPGRMG